MTRESATAGTPQGNRAGATPSAGAGKRESAPPSAAGRRPLRVAVVTPFHNEPDAWLRQCIDSVAAQTHPCTHILVGDGVRRELPVSDTLLHLSLPRGVADFGDTPRAAGGIYAAGLGFDAVTYLDADNWIHRTHVQTLVRAARAKRAAIATCRREYRDYVDGRFLAECRTSDGEAFCDTNCLLLMRRAFGLLPVWALMDPAFHVLDDRVMWYQVCRSGLPRAHTDRATVAYRASHAGIYHDLGLPAPAGTKRVTGVRAALRAWRERRLPELDLKWRYRLRPSNPDRSW